MKSKLIYFKRIEMIYEFEFPTLKSAKFTNKF